MNKGGSIVGGIVILFIGIALLWWNEGNNVRNLQSVSEGMKNYTDVKSDKIDSKYDKRLVATSGKIVVNSDVTDYEFNISRNSAVLKRTVEMYQWQEDCEGDEENKNCTYEKVWSSSLIDSSEFTKSDHDNPTKMAYESETFISDDVNLGAFKLTDNLVKKMSAKKRIKELSEDVATAHSMRLADNYYTTASEEGANIGDIRISFYENDAKVVSVLAMQTGDHFKIYKTKKGKNFFNLYEDEYDGYDMFQMIAKNNNFGKWLFRIVGILCTILGVSSLFSPIQNLANKVPVLGSIVGVATGSVSFVLGLALSLVVIALAWFRFRPLLSIILIVVVVALIVFLKMQGGKSPSKESK